MSRAWWIAVARLTALVVCIGLATTRLGLVAHELVGHGGATVAVGGTVREVHLFYFAGGWIRFSAPQGGLVIALGGIVVEAAVGIALCLVFARRTTLGARITTAIGAALVLHASWYLATGTWHGYGDGVQLHRDLGDAKWMVAIPVAAVTIAAGYLGARTVLSALAATLPGGARARVAGTVIALIVAGGVQAAAAVGEVMIRRDAAYGSVMKPERQRRIAGDLARWEAEQAQRGAAPTEQQRAQLQRELAARHRTFPLAIVLAILTAMAMVAGWVRAQRAEDGPVGKALLARCAVLAGGSIALVIALDAAFH
ncbi:MAG: hypothetical protein H0T46_28165 [Deltaproteobacteria bacterium]|nr:hypothetical protein [Deltaproteobacteria bacterium]